MADSLSAIADELDKLSLHDDHFGYNLMDKGDLVARLRALDEPVKQVLHEPYATLIGLGVTYSRLKGALDGRDNWGKLVHAFEYLAALGALLDSWPEDMRDG